MALGGKRGLHSVIVNEFLSAFTLKKLILMIYGLKDKKNSNNAIEIQGGVTNNFSLKSTLTEGLDLKYFRWFSCLS
jgi:hypothetical protein